MATSIIVESVAERTGEQEAYAPGGYDNYHLQPVAPLEISGNSERSSSVISQGLKIRLRSLDHSRDKVIEPEEWLTDVNPMEFVLTPMWIAISEQAAEAFLYFCAGYFTNIDNCDFESQSNMRMGAILMTLGAVMFLKVMWYLLVRTFTELKQQKVFVNIMSALVHLMNYFLFIYMILMIVIASKISLREELFCRGTFFTIAWVLSLYTTYRLIITDLKETLKETFKCIIRGECKKRLLE